MSGTLYGVGVGPGDPDLLTIKAVRLIEAAKVIAFPAPDTGPSFARAIVSEFIAKDVVEIPMVVPMRTERFPAQSIYDDSARLIAEHLRAGMDVIVLCEGDPFFYGSFMYLYDRLADDFSCEIIPGVSSLTACASRLKQPLAARKDVLSVIPGTLEDEPFRQRLAQGGSFAIIKVGRHFDRIRALVEEAGLLDKAGYVERASLPDEKVIPLAEVGDTDAPYFSMILIYNGAEAWTTS